MELRHLRYFEAVATERNFTRAAQRLGVAQPPLSRQIRELEIEIGIDLFDRASRPIRLTEAGRMFQEQASQILARTEQLRRSMRRFATSGRQRYVVGFVSSVVYGTLPDVIRRFRTVVASTDVQLLEMTTLEQVAALREGRIDAGIGRIRIDEPAVRREILYEEPLVVALAAQHPLADRHYVHLRDLIAEKLILYPSQPRPSYADQLLSLFRDHNLNPEEIEEVREVQTALGLVAADAGSTIVPASMRRLHRDDIRYVPIADEGATSPVIIIFREGDISAETSIFRQIAHQLFASCND